MSLYHCLACGRELPDLSEQLKQSSGCDINMVFCVCQAVMTIDNGALRPPKVDETFLFVNKIWPTVMKDPVIAEAVRHTAECLDPSNIQYACFSNRDEAPYPIIKNFAADDQCPACKKPFNKMRGARVPRPGGLTLCSNCCAVSVLGDDMKSRPPTDEERESEFYQKALSTAAAVAVSKAERQATS